MSFNVWKMHIYIMFYIATIFKENQYLSNFDLVSKNNTHNYLKRS